MTLNTKRDGSDLKELEIDGYWRFSTGKSAPVKGSKKNVSEGMAKEPEA
jgi:hypothetical protein